MLLSNLINALVILVLGFLIKKFKLAFLISGYNTASKEKKEKYDKDKLVKVTGDMLMTSSLFLFVPVILSFVVKTLEETVFYYSWVAFSAFIIISVIYLNVNDSSIKK